jgi:HK97 gp10 family phage protein
MADLEVKGLAELRTRMAGIPDKLIKNALRSGLRKGATVVRNQARENFNAAGGPNDLTGALKASIRVTPRRGTPTRVVFSVSAGALTKAQTKKFGADSAYYALWVERGHINRKLGAALRGGTRRKAAARAASTNNTPAHPFMRPAIEAKAKEAIDIMVQAVAEKLPELGK